MTLHVFENLEQGTEEWHDARRGIVTASTIGQLITAKTLKPASNDYSRALTAQLVAERICGWTDDAYVNSDMMRGTLDEPVARDLYSRHFAPVTEVGFLVRELAAGIRLGYSPDGLVGSDGLVEIKSPRAKAHLQTILSGEVPDRHMPQLQAGLFVSGREWVDFVSFCGGMRLYVTRVYPDPAWHDAIRETVERFEETAAAMVADYEAATADMPDTERINHFAEVVI
jgi:hypothetical protein